MSSNDKVFEHENVNGVALYLVVENRKGSPKSINFTISYKNKGNKTIWPYVSLFLAVLFNIVSIAYIRISVTAIIVIITVFSFLLLFWITHSVQTESLLVIPSVGIQSSIKYVFGREDNFIPWSSVDDIIINEVIKLAARSAAIQTALCVGGIRLTLIILKLKFIVAAKQTIFSISLQLKNRNRVLYFLTVLVRNTNEDNQNTEPVRLIPLFKYTKPRLVMIQAIYSDLQTLLIESQRGASATGSGDVG